MTLTIGAIKRLEYLIIFTIYSSPSLIRLYHICQEIVDTFERWPLVRGRSTLIVVAAKICGHIREHGLCWGWPLREGLLYSPPHPPSSPVRIPVLGWAWHTGTEPSQPPPSGLPDPLLISRDRPAASCYDGTGNSQTENSESGPLTGW